ncbi:MAG: hypothetical protein ACKO9Z_08240 [Planctomycetota bacterium]
MVSLAKAVDLAAVSLAKVVDSVGANLAKVVVDLAEASRAVLVEASVEALEEGLAEVDLVVEALTIRSALTLLDL